MVPEAERGGAEMNRAQCSDCQELTKIPVGFWDGRDKNGRRASGFLYDCNNTDCPIKQEAMMAELEAEQKELKTQEENRQNGVDIQEMIRSRRQAELTIRDCAQALGVSLSKYSDYEHERAPMPLQEWQKIMAIIREEVSHGNHSRTITSQEPYSCLGTGAWPGSHRR
jgi:DNA-binding transcriptional regulator YiaG